jgi:hypothetical protein
MVLVDLGGMDTVVHPAAVVDMRAMAMMARRGEQSFFCSRLVSVYGMATVMHVSMPKHEAALYATLPSTDANVGSKPACVTVRNDWVATKDVMDSMANAAMPIERQSGNIRASAASAAKWAS